MDTNKYRTKPITIEAIQYTGENLADVLEFTGRHPKFDLLFKSFDEYQKHVENDGRIFKIFTPEGTMDATPGDWIIRGVTGELAPCKADVFATRYESAALVPSDAAQAPVAYHFHRFVDGDERAEDILIERAATLEAAVKAAVKCCPPRAMTVLVHAPAWPGTLHGGAIADRLNNDAAPVAVQAPQVADVGEIWPSATVIVDAQGNVTGGKLYPPGLPPGTHNLFPVRVQYVDDYRDAWFAVSDALRAVDSDYLNPKIRRSAPAIEQALAAIRRLAAAPRFVKLKGLRKKLLTPRNILRSENGWLSHADYPVCDEGTRADKFLEAFGIETAFVSMESDLPAFSERWHEQGLNDCSGWTPTPPRGNGWLLLEIYDTASGPYAMFGRDKQEAENALKRKRTRELSVRIQQSAAMDGDKKP